MKYRIIKEGNVYKVQRQYYVRNLLNWLRFDYPFEKRYKLTWHTLQHRVDNFGIDGSGSEYYKDITFDSVEAAEVHVYSLALKKAIQKVIKEIEFKDG